MDKTTLKKAYKEAQHPMGIYKISSTELEEVYIGYSTNLLAITNRHRFELKFGTHRNRELQGIWNRLGEAVFNFEVVDVLQPRETSDSDAIEELQTLLEMWTHKLSSEGVSLVLI